MSLSASLIFFILGAGQAIIYFVMRRFVKVTGAGQPTPLLRGIVAIIGSVAVALFLAGVYLALAVNGE